MPNYIRAKFEGGYYFFTVVTYRRARLFETQLARDSLRQAISRTRTSHPFETTAFCLLPDHLHCVWKLPQGDADFSMRWASIKGIFSREYPRPERHQHVALSRANKGGLCIWQKRFWEHQIRDEWDLQRHIDYIHYNPVKHGLVKSAEDWPWSTYHRYVEQGHYGTTDGFAGIVAHDTTDFGE